MTELTKEQFAVSQLLKAVEYIVTSGKTDQAKRLIQEALETIEDKVPAGYI